MGWRTVVVSNRAKLDLKYGSLVIRTNEDIVKIHIPEISSVIIESTAVSLTSALLCELIENKVSVIFCDKSRDPISELIPYHASHDSSLKIKEQMDWDNEFKSILWKRIVEEKIIKQAELLEKYGIKTHSMLDDYAKEVECGDATNREAHAAKVYFNSLFGKDFSRHEETSINAALNYGYQILLSTFNREIVKSGYLTQLGIFHSNRFNHFNLSSDFMEPFRIIVDELVLENMFESFSTEEKRIMQTLHAKQVYVSGKKQYLNNAIQIYVKSLFDALNEQNIDKIRFYRNEL